MSDQQNLLITIGNVYLDHNAHGVNSNGQDQLEAGKEYFAAQYETVLGGSALNFAMQAINLGSRVAFLGRVGADEDGKEIKRLLNEKSIIPDLVSTVDGEVTSSAFNMILKHNGEFVGIHWGDASKNLDPEQIDVTHPLFKKANAVYFGGTAKQPNIFNNFPSVLKKLHEIGIKIIIDPNRFPVTSETQSQDSLLESLQYVDCYLPNVEEIKQATGQEDLESAISNVLEKGVKLIVIKLGSKGCRIISLIVDLTVSGFKVDPKTTVGAGDSFNSGFITQWLDGKSLEESAKYANAVAAIKVGQNKWASLSEVEEFLRNN